MIRTIDGLARQRPKHGRAECSAAEITVLGGMAWCRGCATSPPPSSAPPGTKVIVSFEAGPSLMQKINAGAPADLVTHYPDVIDDLIN